MAALSDRDPRVHFFQHGLRKTGTDLTDEVVQAGYDAARAVSRRVYMGLWRPIAERHELAAGRPLLGVDHMDIKAKTHALRMIPYGLYVLTARTDDAADIAAGINAATVSCQNDLSALDMAETGWHYGG
jgi:hypothetical protein